MVTTRKQKVHVYISDERMGKAAGRVFGSDIEEWRVFADFEQEDGGVSTTS